MVVAADYPLLDVFWTILIFFAWVAWIYLVFTVLADVFRRHDIGGWSKAAWTVFVIVLPFAGVLTYLIVNSKDMAVRNEKDAEAAQAQIDDRIRSVATSGGDGAATEIEKAKRLLDNGTIDENEFARIKQKAMA